MKNRIKYKTIIKYFFFFFLFLYATVISYNVFFNDTIVNYGFSYAISRGEIPYNDYNLIIPLFSPWLYTIPLLITKNFIAYYIFHSILLVFLFFILEKLIKKNIYILLPLIFLGYPICLFSAFFPGYNFILFLLIILLMYVEKTNKNEKIKGLLIGLSIITKHTIGLFLLLLELIYSIITKTKIKEKIKYCSIPVILFVAYLLITKSLKNFIDLCILGMFDFASSNNKIDIISIVLLILCIIYNIYLIKKDKKEITNYYLLIMALYIIPIIDSYHVSFYVLGCLIRFFQNKELKITKNKTLAMNSIILITALNIIWTSFIFIQGYQIKKYNNYPTRIVKDEMDNNYKEMTKYLKQTNKNIVLFDIGTENYFNKIINNLDITYFDLPNYGNYGYNSYKKMTARIDNLQDTMIVLNKEILKIEKSNQYYMPLARYIEKTCLKQEEFAGYVTYYKE